MRSPYIRENIQVGARVPDAAPRRARALGRYAVAGCAVLVAGVALADGSPPMYFDHLTVRDGLSQSTANTVMQDSQGFIWIGTESGLNRYDGYNLVRYQSRRDDPESLPSDFIWDIEEDREGNL
ncbi:MAG: two-component regulator propeller domain-containing protein, partial [Pseudomonadota bacterium]